MIFFKCYMLVKIIFFLFLISIYQNNKKILKKNINLKFLKKIKNFKKYSRNALPNVDFKKSQPYPQFSDLPRSKAQVSGFDRVTRSPRSIFLKSKRHRFIKKKQKSTDCDRVFDQVLPSQLGFSFLYFFFNPVRFQPLVDLSGRVSKL